MIGFAASDQLASQIAAAMLMCDLEDLESDDVDDALGEFLNLLVGSAKTRASVSSDQGRLSPPQSDGFPSEGFSLHLVTNRGSGCLLFQTEPPSQ